MFLLPLGCLDAANPTLVSCYWSTCPLSRNRFPRNKWLICQQDFVRAATIERQREIKRIKSKGHRRRNKRFMRLMLLWFSQEQMKYQSFENYIKHRKNCHDLQNHFLFRAFLFLLLSLVFCQLSASLTNLCFHITYSQSPHRPSDKDPCAKAALIILLKLFVLYK